MVKLMANAAAAALALMSVPGAAQAALGPDAAACRGGKAVRPCSSPSTASASAPAMSASRFTAATRAASSARGQTLRKIDRAGHPRRADADLRRCAQRRPLRDRGPPRRRRQRPVGDWSDGGGFSRNPRISLTNLRPRYDNVAINVGRGVHAGERRPQLPLRPLHPPGPAS